MGQPTRGRLAVHIRSRRRGYCIMAVLRTRVPALARRDVCGILSCLLHGTGRARAEAHGSEKIVVEFRRAFLGSFSTFPVRLCGAAKSGAACYVAAAVVLLPCRKYFCHPADHHLFLSLSLSLSLSPPMASCYLLAVYIDRRSGTHGCNLGGREIPPRLRLNFATLSVVVGAGLAENSRAGRNGFYGTSGTE